MFEHIVHLATVLICVEAVKQIGEFIEKWPRMVFVSELINRQQVVVEVNNRIILPNTQLTHPDRFSKLHAR